MFQRSPSHQSKPSVVYYQTRSAIVSPDVVLFQCGRYVLLSPHNEDTQLQIPSEQFVCRDLLLLSQVCFFKPLHCFRPPVWTPRPATRLTLSFFQIGYQADYMFLPCFCFPDNGCPANPFIALNRCKVVPDWYQRGI